MSDFVKLSLSRFVHNMLKEHAEYEQKPMAQLVSELVIERVNSVERKSHRLLSDIGITAHTVGTTPVVAISLESAPLTVLSTTEASTLADAIERTAKAGVRSSFEFTTTTERGKRLVRTFRRGRGLVLAINDTERSFPFVVAQQIAAEMRRHTARAGALATSADAAAHAPTIVDRSGNASA